MTSSELSVSKTVGIDCLDPPGHMPALLCRGLATVVDNLTTVENSLLRFYQVKDMTYSDACFSQVFSAPTTPTTTVMYDAPAKGGMPSHIKQILEEKLRLAKKVQGELTEFYFVKDLSY
ncbi:MAG: hypothetical protein JKY60_08640 [Kordiimonadaceae bacterium]|nr:hypothetical protein [Kordiimonadaceae bacterium]